MSISLIRKRRFSPLKVKISASAAANFNSGNLKRKIPIDPLQAAKVSKILNKKYKKKGAKIQFLSF